MSTRSEIRERWRSILREQPASGLSVKEFCRQAGVQCSGYYKWQRKLSGKRKREARTFAEVRLRPAKVSSIELGVASAEGQIEVRLGGGRSIVVPRGFDRQTLIAVLDVLEGGSAGSAGREAAR